MENVKQALTGLKVIEWGEFVSAPYCAKLLADLGAEVIKIETPVTGDEARRYGPFPDDVPHPEKSGLFLYLNTNKLGVTLDVCSKSGRDIFNRLIADADVLVENWGPKRLRDMGVSFEDVNRVNPRLVMTSISAFGQTGPYRDYNAYDINSSALGGASYTVGDPKREPLNLPGNQSDYQGGVHAASATLAALLARRRTGKGQHVDISESEIWAILYGGAGISAYIFQGQVRIRAGHRTPGFYPYTILPCKDGYVSLIAGRGSQWKAFLELMGDGQLPEWYAKDTRFRDRLKMSWQYADELDSLLAPWMMQHTKQEIFKLCQAKNIPFAPVNSIAEVVEEPHLKQRGYFVEVEHKEAGTFRYPGAPYKLSETPWLTIRPAPRLGEHNREIYGQRLGLSGQEMVALYQGGTI